MTLKTMKQNKTITTINGKYINACGGRGITTFLSFEYQLPEHKVSGGVN
jgi:hypothetical protein